jgi:Peptidoglycan-binding protein, CsiV
MNYIKYALAVSFVVFSHIVTAASWYQVEVVVFDRLNPDLDGEQWQNEDFTIRDNLLELQPGDVAVNASEGLVPYMILDKGRNRLNGVQRTFKLSSQYRPLIHLSWQQPAAQRRQSRYVHLQRLDGDQSIPVADASNPDVEPEFLDEIIPLDRVVDGSIRIRSGFYLHADIDFSYFKDLPAENKILRSSEESFISAIDKTVIKLKETRKLKLNEIHYFDHPMFGVILQVSRLNLP